MNMFAVLATILLTLCFISTMTFIMTNKKTFIFSSMALVAAGTVIGLLPAFI